MGDGSDRGATAAARTHSAALSAACECRVTAAGLFVAIGAAFLLGYGLAAGAFAAAVAGTALLLTWWAARRRAGAHLLGLSLGRRLPRRSWAGRSFAVECAASGPLPPGAAARVRFRDAINPERRWLSWPENGGVLRYVGRHPQRGIIGAGKWELESTWPLGWFATRLSGRFELEARPALSLPPPALPAALSHTVASQIAAWRRGAAWAEEHSSEFRLLRDFRSGDSARAVHWPASLRHGSLLVRESEPPPPRGGRIGVLLHSCDAPRHDSEQRGALRLSRPEEYEQLLKMASGLLRLLRDAGVAVEWRHYPGPARLLRSGRDFDAELDRLATVSRHPIMRLTDLAAAARPLERCGVRLVLSETPREIWEPAIVNALAGVQCIDLRSFSLGRKLRRVR